MKLRFIVTICALALVLSPTGAAAGASDAIPVYYLSLGDSLAAGTQPGRTFTNEGYADQLATLLRPRMPNLRLVKLGCPGETTTSMITPDLPYEGRGGRNACHYPHGSQLAEAVSFLHAHQRSTALVTIDLGPNDLFRGGGVPAIAANFPKILAALRDAAGAGVPIVGMNFYDPRLAQSWFVEHPGDLGALRVEIANAVEFNNFIESLFAAAGDPVADVEAAFRTTDTTLVGTTPRDVVLVCAWTWICAPEQDIHANATGYGVIAVAFLGKL
jgi:lysophospholipase L1-like esterase